MAAPYGAGRDHVDRAERVSDLILAVATIALFALMFAFASWFDRI
jgi:hypothetical protein